MSGLGSGLVPGLESGLSPDYVRTLVLSPDLSPD